MKKNIFLIICVVLCIGAVTFAVVRMSDPIEPTPVATSTPVTGIMRAERQSLSTTTPYVEVSIEYPRLIGDYFHVDAIEKANKSIEDYALKGMDDFIFQSEKDKPVRPYEINVTYELAPVSESLVQIYFSHYTDTGGAHGRSMTSVYKLERATGEVLEDGDVFVDVAKLRRDIYALVKDEVINTKMEKFNMSEKEALESWDSFTAIETRKGWDSLALHEEGVEFWFTQYSLGAYVEGEYAVVVPWVKLASYLQTSYK